jgi:glutaminyl-peptide cyclotransferase
MKSALGCAVLCCALLGCDEAAKVSADGPGTTPAASPTSSPLPIAIDGAQAAATAAAAKFDSSKAWDHLRAMVAIGERPSGSAAIRETRAYITRQIRAMNLVVEEQPFIGQTPKGPIEMVNLIVKLPGRRTDRILFTGHYDTKLLKGFVGASDGASSAAFLIELARVLKDQPREFSYEFVWFDGEEAVVSWVTGVDSTYGSRYYVQAAKRAPTAINSIKAMILIDMIGDKNLTLRREQNSTGWLKDAIWGTAKKLGHGNVFMDEETPIEDDHLEFLKAGVPSVDIIDLDYPEWHNDAACCDDLTKVSARSLQIVGDVLLAALPEITKRAIAGK